MTAAAATAGVGAPAGQASTAGVGAPAGQANTAPVIHSVEEFRAALAAGRAAGRRVGLVPTMGALHHGHASLVRAAARDCDMVAVTIFVNPLQFGAGEDYATYPRDLARDRAVVAESGATMVFAPPLEEMEPAGGTLTRVHVAGVSEGLEGSARPGHFAGVATVVARLLAVAGPCRAYFGEKDYQQLLVVQRLVADLRFPAEVVACATVREADGLAASSRNTLLAPAERAAAPVLHRALQAGRARVESGERNPDEVRREMADVIAGEPLAVPDYVEVRDAASLAPVDTLAGEVRLLVAVRVGAVRLIDNLAATCRVAAEEERT